MSTVGNALILVCTVFLFIRGLIAICYLWNRGFRMDLRDLVAKEEVPLEGREPASSEEPGITVIYECANGHVQTMTYKGMDREWVDIHRGLVDGTSPMYVYPPDDSSVIGKCGICGARITSRVKE